MCSSHHCSIHLFNTSCFNLRQTSIDSYVVGQTKVTSSVFRCVSFPTTGVCPPKTSRVSWGRHDLTTISFGPERMKLVRDFLCFAFLDRYWRAGGCSSRPVRSHRDRPEAERQNRPLAGQTLAGCAAIAGSGPTNSQMPTKAYTEPAVQRLG